MFNRMHFTIKGVAPLLMHNSRLADPLDPFTRELARLSKGKAKSDESREIMGRVEWSGSLYHTEGDIDIADGIVTWDPSIRVVMPAANLHACLTDGAKAAKLGKTFKAAVHVLDDAFLEYDGPKDINVLMTNGRFISRKPAKLGGRSTVMRTRPVFRSWALTFTLQYNREVLDEDRVFEALVHAGRTCGIGDWKPQNGRFEVVV